MLGIFLICGKQILTAQNIAINSTGAAPNSSAMLDVQSSTKGMLVPRMTTAQRKAIASPATGLLVFDNTTGSFWFKSASRWVELVDSTNTIWTKNGSDVYLNNGENMGVGTNNPAVRLQVSNGTDIANLTGGYLQLGATSTANLALDNNEIQARDNDGASNLYMQVGGGYLGVGTNNPEVKLQVNNGTDVSASGGGYLQLGSGSVSNLALDNNEVQARNDGAASALYLQNNGGSLQVGSASGSTTDVHINNGKLIKPVTGSANMMPLCYGHVSAAGKLISGTSNVSIIKGSAAGEYYISCSGVTSSTILMIAPNDIHGAARINVAYNGTNQAYVLALDAGEDPTNYPFSFVFYNQ
jgi:trimeric autotransporter adhesin